MKILRYLPKAFCLLFLFFQFLPTLIPANAEESFKVGLIFGLGHYFEVSEDKFDIYRGMPIDMTVYLANLKAIRDISNLLSERIAEKIRAGETYDIEREKSNLINELITANKIQVIKIGNENFRWQEAIKFLADGQDWTNYLSREGTTSPTTLTATRVEETWYLPPEKTENMPTGSYKITAIFDTEALTSTHPDIWHGKVVSNQIEFILKEAKTDSEKAWKSCAIAEYYRTQKNYEKGMESATTGLQHNPNLVELHAVTGELYEAKGDYEKALTEMETALKLFYEQNPKFPEHPQGILVRIHRLKKRLNR